MTNENIRITKDNFVWKIVGEEAKEVWSSGCFELYILHEDDTETLIEDSDQFERAYGDAVIGIEVGFLPE